MFRLQIIKVYNEQNVCALLFGYLFRSLDFNVQWWGCGCSNVFQAARQYHQWQIHQLFHRSSRTTRHEQRERVSEICFWARYFTIKLKSIIKWCFFLQSRDGFFYRMMESGPCYLKIYGNNTNEMHLSGESIDLKSSKLPLEQLERVYSVLKLVYFFS